MLLKENLNLQMNINEKIITIIAVILLALLIANIWQKDDKVDDIPVKLQQPEFFLYDTPADSLVYQACVYYDIHHPEIVVSQSILETGYYRSEGCKKDNNLFGLYNSRAKEYYKFNHWTESVLKYKEWIQYRYKDGENYYHFLDRIGYADDSLYIQKIKSIGYVY